LPLKTVLSLTGAWAIARISAVGFATSAEKIVRHISRRFLVNYSLVNYIPVNYIPVNYRRTTTGRVTTGLAIGRSRSALSASREWDAKFTSSFGERLQIGDDVRPVAGIGHSWEQAHRRAGEHGLGIGEPLIEILFGPYYAQFPK
jgi:hypothetical protein